MEQKTRLKKGDLLQDRYEIDSAIGKGGTGYTYLAKDKEKKINVVLKVLYVSEIRNWKELDLFKREIEVLENIDYPLIPNYHNFFEAEIVDETLLVLVQEHVQGKNLYEQVKGGKTFSLEEIRDIILSLFKTLSYIHNLQPPIIHRDVNPKNIIVDDKDQVYLVDFGATGQMTDSTIAAARSSTFVGTIGYMPPEQLFGKSTPASDLYALGATIIFMLTKKGPIEFELDKMKLAYHPYVQIPAGLRNLIDRLIEPDVKQRLDSAGRGIGILKNIVIVKNPGKPGKKKEVKESAEKSPLTTPDTRLLKAIKNDDYIRTAELIFMGADLNLKNGDGRTLLFYAANCEGEKTYIRNLSIGENSALEIENGARMILGKHAGSIPFKIAKLLVRFGAEIDIEDKNGKTPADYAEQGGLSALTDFLKEFKDYTKNEIEKKLKPEKEDKEILQGVLWKALRQDIKAVKRLIALGANINKKDKKGNTSLSQAVSGNKFEIARFLLENGTDIDEKVRGRTLLHRAVQDKKINQVKFLIEYGAGIDLKDDKAGQTPLEIAYKRGYKEIEKLLLECGADEEEKYEIKNRLKAISDPPRRIPLSIRYSLRWVKASAFLTLSALIILIIAIFAWNEGVKWVDSLMLMLGDTENTTGKVFRINSKGIHFQYKVGNETYNRIGNTLLKTFEKDQSVKIIYLKSNPGIARAEGTVVLNLGQFFTSLGFPIIYIPILLYFLRIWRPSRSVRRKYDPVSGEAAMQSPPVLTWRQHIKLLRYGKIADAVILKNNTVEEEYYYQCFYKYTDDMKEETKAFTYTGRDKWGDKGRISGDHVPLLYLHSKNRRLSLLIDTLPGHLRLKGKFSYNMDRNAWYFKSLSGSSIKSFLNFSFRYLLIGGTLAYTGFGLINILISIFGL